MYNTRAKRTLIQRLCARLLFGFKVRYSSYKEFITCTLHSINPVYDNVYLWSENACFNPVSISKIKPYLFPLSSMTEEEKLMYEGLMIGTDNISYMLDIIDWLNAHHFDYRCLIEKGLAIDATGLNIY